MSDQDIEGVRPYHEAAGGWGALRATAKALAHSRNVLSGAELLLKQNQPNGFELSGLCLAGSETHILFRVLRKRRQGGGLGRQPVSALHRKFLHNIRSVSYGERPITGSRIKGASRTPWHMIGRAAGLSRFPGTMPLRALRES